VPKGIKRGFPITERFSAGYTINTSTGCWEWKGSQATGGYVQMKINKKCVLVHRLSYELHKGEITEGLQINHTCDVKHCVNPEHLYEGTQSDNMKDRSRRNRLDQTGAKNPNYKGGKK